MSQAVDPAELAWAFPEFRPYVAECRFSDCRHVAEPGCGVKAAVEALKRFPNVNASIDGTDIMALNGHDLRAARRHMQMIFQDPFASLNPQMILSHQVAEPLQNFEQLTGQERHERVSDLLDLVDLADVADPVVVLEPAEREEHELAKRGAQSIENAARRQKPPAMNDAPGSTWTYTAPGSFRSPLREKTMPTPRLGTSVTGTSIS